MNSTYDGYDAKLTYIYGHHMMVKYSTIQAKLSSKSIKQTQDITKINKIKNTLPKTGTDFFQGYDSRLGITVSGQFFSMARFFRTDIASFGWFTVNAGAPGLNIPDFWKAMDSRVLPRSDVWSRPRLAMPVHTVPLTMFVQSYSPPMPTCDSKRLIRGFNGKSVDRN